MRLFLSVTCLICSLASFATAEVSITKSPTGWELTNGHIRVELTRAADGVLLRSLRRESGAEWAVNETPLVASPDKSGKPYRFVEDAISDLSKGGKQLTLTFQCDTGGRLSLQLRIYPTGAVIQTAMQIENRGNHDLTSRYSHRSAVSYPEDSSKRPQILFLNEGPARIPCN